MDNMRESYQEKYCAVAEAIDPADPTSEETIALAKILKVLSESPPPEIPSQPKPEPTTFGGKLKQGFVVGWESETTRTIVKAAGAFAGVWLVVRTTIKQDALLERQALDQARQKL